MKNPLPDVAPRPKLYPLYDLQHKTINPFQWIGWGEIAVVVFFVCFLFFFRVFFFKLDILNVLQRVRQFSMEASFIHI